jgi:hypothetical protein
MAPSPNREEKGGGLKTKHLASEMGPKEEEEEVGPPKDERTAKGPAKDQRNEMILQGPQQGQKKCCRWSAICSLGQNINVYGSLSF